AHRLHVRILGGDEQAMGPVWFFEGFAVYASDQFVGAELAPPELPKVVASSQRGSYRSYRALMNYLVSRTDLPELVQWAKEPDFADQLKLLWLQLVEPDPEDQFHFGRDGLTIASHRGIGRVRLFAPQGWPPQLAIRFTYPEGHPMSRIEGLFIETGRGSWRSSTPSPEFRPSIAAWSKPRLQMEGQLPVLTIPADFLADSTELKLHWIDVYR
ncbi:MAG: hypothetical protein KC910_06345, partial [Candidatus Eremiobacteraeota bacterium]|nr:hypothetical protein [Candidatus Eremiobacteraeota bacterium]